MMNREHPEQTTAYVRTQRLLITQLSNAVRITVFVLLAITVVALFAPNINKITVIILGVFLAIELFTLEIVRRLVNSGLVRHAVSVFVVVTLCLGVLFGFPIQSSAFIIAVTGIGILIAALLHGQMLTAVVVFIGFLGYILLEIALQQHWFAESVTAQTDTLVFRIILSAAAVIVLGATGVILGKRFWHANAETELRATESEQSQQKQMELNAELALRIEEQRRLLELVQELEVPIVPLLPGVIVLPLVGHLDSLRLATVQRRFIEHVFTHKISLALVDITGVTLVDATIATAVTHMAQSVRLLGATMALTGIRAAVALELTNLDTAFELKTYATIEGALNAYMHTQHHDSSRDDLFQSEQDTKFAPTKLAV